MTLRVTGIGHTAKPVADDLALGPGDAREQRRRLDQGAPAGVLRRPSPRRRRARASTRLNADQEIPGPAIIEQADGVIVVPPGAIARADRFDNVTLEEAA